LLNVTELLFLSFTVEALQGKMCRNSLPSRGVGHLQPRFQGEGVVLGEYLVSTKLDTFCYLTVQTALCYVPSFWHNSGVWQTDRQTYVQTDRIVVASTALAMRALRRAVKISGSSFSLSYILSAAVNFELLWPLRFQTFWVNNSSTDLYFPYCHSAFYFFKSIYFQIALVKAS